MDAGGVEPQGRRSKALPGTGPNRAPSPGLSIAQAGEAGPRPSSCTTPRTGFTALHRVTLKQSPWLVLVGLSVRGFVFEAHVQGSLLAQCTSLSGSRCLWDDAVGGHAGPPLIGNRAHQIFRREA